jgi:aspartate/methionine/tyrosine aminotransferase
VARPEDFRALVVLCDERGIQLLSNEAYRGVELDQASDTVIVALDQKDLKMLIDRAKDLDQQVQKLIRLAIVA